LAPLRPQGFGWGRRGGGDEGPTARKAVWLFHLSLLAIETLGGYRSSSKGLLNRGKFVYKAKKPEVSPRGFFHRDAYR